MMPNEKLNMKRRIFVILDIVFKMDCNLSFNLLRTKHKEMNYTAGFVVFKFLIMIYEDTLRC